MPRQTRGSKTDQNVMRWQKKLQRAKADAASVLWPSFDVATVLDNPRPWLYVDEITPMPKDSTTTLAPPAAPEVPPMPETLNSQRLWTDAVGDAVFRRDDGVIVGRFFHRSGIELTSVEIVLTQDLVNALARLVQPDAERFRVWYERYAYYWAVDKNVSDPESHVLPSLKWAIDKIDDSQIKANLYQWLLGGKILTPVLPPKPAFARREQLPDPIENPRFAEDLAERLGNRGVQPKREVKKPKADPKSGGVGGGFLKSAQETADTSQGIQVDRGIRGPIVEGNQIINAPTIGAFLSASQYPARLTATMGAGMTGYILNEREQLEIQQAKDQILREQEELNRWAQAPRFGVPPPEVLPYASAARNKPRLTGLFTESMLVSDDVAVTAQSDYFDQISTEVWRTLEASIEIQTGDALTKDRRLKTTGTQRTIDYDRAQNATRFTITCVVLLENVLDATPGDWVRKGALAAVTRDPVDGQSYWMRTRTGPRLVNGIGDNEAWEFFYDAKIGGFQRIR